jgi:hypothetical protein
MYLHFKDVIILMNDHSLKKDAINIKANYNSFRNRQRSLWYNKIKTQCRMENKSLNVYQTKVSRTKWKGR